MPHALNAAYALLVREGRALGWTRTELDEKLEQGWSPEPDEQEAQDEFMAAFGVSMGSLE